MNKLFINFFIILNCIGFSLHSQESTRAIAIQKIGVNQSANTVQKTTNSTLPFFDDFTELDGHPNNLNWLPGGGVYINNHLGTEVKSRGVATFDANDMYGTPYDTLNAYNTLAADSLTSVPIDLSPYHPNDNIFLSFFLQAGGWGYQPKDEDSMKIYFKNNLGIWVKVVSIAPTYHSNFEEVYIKVEDTQYYHENFAIKFVNTATKGISNSHWHVDYVRLDKDRSPSDEIKDIAFVHTGSSILTTYTAMPFKHYAANKSKYFSNSLKYSINNLSNTSVNLQVLYKATTNDGNNLGSGTQSITVPPASSINNSMPLYAPTVHNPANIEDTFYYAHNLSFEDPNEPNGNPNNQINFRQVFENYYAYDDGSAEKAYFIHMHPSYNIQALNAIPFDFEIADSLRGVAIYFPKEVPLPRNKEFAIRVYKELSVNGGQDVAIHEEQFLYPTFSDTINQFSVYKFEKAIAVANGLHYITIVQLAGGFSDSLYIGLDLHDTNVVQQRFINTAGTWEPSTIKGALMVRPILGKDFSTISTSDVLSNSLNIYPNPTQDKLFITNESQGIYSYKIYNSLGQVVISNELLHNNMIDVSALSNGMYLLQLFDANRKPYPIYRFTKIDE